MDAAAVASAAEVLRQITALERQRAMWVKASTVEVEIEQATRNAGPKMGIRNFMLVQLRPDNIYGHSTNSGPLIEFGKGPILDAVNRALMSYFAQAILELDQELVKLGVVRDSGEQP